MTGQLSITFSDTYMVILEDDDIVTQLKPKFYKRYVDDMFKRRKVNTNDTVFERLNNYHPKIKPS